MKTPLLVVFAALLAAAALASPGMGPRVGDPAPNFALPYATRDSIASDSLRLSNLEGQRSIVLAFYPADWSSGCTKEVCSLRDNFKQLGALNADVIGISGDYVFSHFEWAKHHDLPFRLASDHKHDVAKLYASYNEGSGHDYRTVYVIDRTGKIAYVDLAYSVRDSVSFGKLHAALEGMK
ncbi:MAG TPA: peroxiredoxin [Polyangiaceae bacterium]|nr:peroxiredoxin [Polyangiaceae bacterium]